MPRVFYKKYNDHDDRASSSNNIRKVSFKNGGGRVNRKNRRPDLVSRALLNDDDIDMSGDQKNWKGARNGRKKFFKGRARSPVMRQSNQQLTPVYDWYEVRIFYGSRYPKNELLQLIFTKISPSVFIPNSYQVLGNDVVFYVDDLVIAKMLRNINRNIVLPDGHLMQIKVTNGKPPSVPIDDSLKTKIKLVMAKRYLADKKALDLSKFYSDPDFGETYCPLSRPAVMRAVWQIAQENIPDLVAVNLSNNKIRVLDDSSSVEIKKLKDLKIVHLGNNNIKTLNVLNCFKGLELTELVLSGNPVVKFFKERTHFVRYDSGVTDIRKKFPKLLKLDDMELPPVISFDVGVESKLPSPQAAYICNQDGLGIVKAFLSQYFALYDSDNRLDLAQAYHDTSCFSLCAFYPPLQKSNCYRLNNYIEESRNLFRVQDYHRRKNRLHMGKENIVKFLTQLPKSNHDLLSFAVDLTLFTPVLINLTVSGVFREPSTGTIAKTWPVRHFSRTFLIVPVGQGFCIINDMLLVTNATETQIKCSFSEETPNSTILQSPAGTSSNPASLVQMPSPGVNIKLTDEVRLQMVQALSLKTGMNVEWSKKCLDETLWEFDRAVWTFNELQSKGSIPAEAFVK